MRSIDLYGNQQIILKLEEETRKFLIRSLDLYGAETWTLWKVDQKYRKFSERDAGERWRSFGPIVREMKQYCIESRTTGMFYMQ
jgi:hypothetical protein